MMLLEDKLFFPLTIPEGVPQDAYPEYAQEVFDLLKNEGATLNHAEAMALDTIRKKRFERMYKEEIPE